MMASARSKTAVSSMCARSAQATTGGPSAGLTGVTQTCRDQREALKSSTLGGEQPQQQETDRGIVPPSGLPCFELCWNVIMLSTHILTVVGYIKLRNKDVVAQGIMGVFVFLLSNFAYSGRRDRWIPLDQGPDKATESQAKINCQCPPGRENSADATRATRMEGVAGTAPR